MIVYNVKIEWKGESTLELRKKNHSARTCAFVFVSPSHAPLNTSTLGSLVIPETEDVPIGSLILYLWIHREIPPLMFLLNAIMYKCAVDIESGSFSSILRTPTSLITVVTRPQPQQGDGLRSAPTQLALSSCRWTTLHSFTTSNFLLALSYVVEIVTVDRLVGVTLSLSSGSTIDWFSGACDILLCGSDLGNGCRVELPAVGTSRSIAGSVCIIALKMD